MRLITLWNGSFRIGRLYFRRPWKSLWILFWVLYVNQPQGLIPDDEGHWTYSPFLAARSLVSLFITLGVFELGVRDALNEGNLVWMPPRPHSLWARWWAALTAPVTIGPLLCRRGWWALRHLRWPLLGGLLLALSWYGDTPEQVAASWSSIYQKALVFMTLGAIIYAVFAARRSWEFVWHSERQHLPPPPGKPLHREGSAPSILRQRDDFDLEPSLRPITDLQRYNERPISPASPFGGRRWLGRSGIQRLRWHRMEIEVVRCQANLQHHLINSGRPERRASWSTAPNLLAARSGWQELHAPVRNRAATAPGILNGRARFRRSILSAPARERRRRRQRDQTSRPPAPPSASAAAG